MDRREGIYEVANDKLSDRRAEFAVAFEGLKENLGKRWGTLKNKMNGNARAIANAERGVKEGEGQKKADEIILAAFRQRIAADDQRREAAANSPEELHYTVELPDQGVEELSVVIDFNVAEGSPEEELESVS